MYIIILYINVLYKNWNRGENSTVSAVVQLPWREHLFYASLPTRANKSGGRSPVDGNDAPLPWAHFRSVRPSDASTYNIIPKCCTKVLSRTQVLREKGFFSRLYSPVAATPRSSQYMTTVYNIVIILYVYKNGKIIFCVLTKHHPATTTLRPARDDGGGGVSVSVRGPRWLEDGRGGST